MKDLDTGLLVTINYFGVNTQQRKLQEEVFELQEAIYELENSPLSEYENRLDNFKKEYINYLIIQHDIKLNSDFPIYRENLYKGRVLKK